MIARDVRRNYKEIDRLAGAFLGLFGPAFTNTGNGHIETDIAGAASVAGVLVLREAVPDLDRHEAGSVILSDIGKRQGDILAFMRDVAFSLGLEPKGSWEEGVPPDHAPLYTTLELGGRLEAGYRALCAVSPLAEAFWPHGAALAAMKLVAAGQHMKILDQSIGKSLAVSAFIAASKTVPRRLPGASPE